LPPIGSRSNRFDPPDGPAAYFADSAHTALYETVLRREKRSCSLDEFDKRVLVKAVSSARLRLADMRDLVGRYPYLVSMRYEPCQHLAQAFTEVGLDGVIYPSCQHPGHSCVAVFAGALEKLRRTSIRPLRNSEGALLRVAMDALHGSGLPLTP
jgi:RES domain-containing protein